MNLDIKLDDLPRVSKDTQGFMLKKIRLNLGDESRELVKSVICSFAEDISNFNHSILPELNGGTQVSVVNSNFKEGSAASLNLFLCDSEKLNLPSLVDTRLSELRGKSISGDALQIVEDSLKTLFNSVLEKWDKDF